jgi:hypothetical protein
MSTSTEFIPAKIVQCHTEKSLPDYFPSLNIAERLSRASTSDLSLPKRVGMQSPPVPRDKSPSAPLMELHSIEV